MNTPIQVLENLEHSFVSDSLQIEYQELASELSDRELFILTNRILPASTEAKTLQEVADKFSITREAIRLNENRLLAKIEELKTLKLDFSLSVAHQLKEAFGALTPVSYVPPSLIHLLATPHGSLVRFLAAGYPIVKSRRSSEFEAGVFAFRSESADVRAFIKDAISRCESNDAEIVDAAELEKALIQSGIAEWVAQRLLSTSSEIGSFDSRRFLIPDSLNEKFKLFLRLQGTPQTPEDSLAFLSSMGKVNIRSLKNAISTDDEISKVTANSYALKIWGMSEFNSLLESVEDFLILNGLTALNVLQDALHAKFAAKRSSVAMYAQMHPKFVYSNGFVRLRMSDEPVPYGLNIEQESSCFRSEDSWCWRVIVNNDVLRGSGIAIPKALAEFVGLAPDGLRIFSHDLGDISFTWRGIYPTVSALRTIAEKFGTVEGDYLFLTFNKEVNNVTLDKRDGFNSELDAEINIVNYLSATKSETAEIAIQRAFDTKLSGQALWDFLEMRAEVTNDRDLNWIIDQRRSAKIN
jgi:hypothetical protein